MQPIIIQDAISIAANSVNQNVIASNDGLRQLLRLPYNAKIALAAVQSAAGLLIDFDAGSDNLVASSNCRVSASTPEIPLDVVNGEGFGMEGNILVLKASNPTGGAITLRYLIVAEYVDQVGFQTRVMQQGPISIANGSVDFQLLDGLRYERAVRPSIMDILMTSSAAGLTRELFVDSDRIAPASTISLANRVPQDPFDQTVGGVQVPEDKEIMLQVTNQSGGALSVFWKQILQEVG